MSSFLSTQLKNDSLARAQITPLKFIVLNTAKVLTFPGQEAFLQGQMIVGCDAGDFTQAACDALLGSTNEFVTATMFGSTAMGTDAFGFILNCNGQLKSIEYMKYTHWLATEVANFVIGTTTAPTNALTEVAYMSTAGNVAGRIIAAGSDAGTAYLEVELGVTLK